MLLTFEESNLYFVVKYRGIKLCNNEADIIHRCLLLNNLHLVSCNSGNNHGALFIWEEIILFHIRYISI